MLGLGADSSKNCGSMVAKVVAAIVLAAPRIVDLVIEMAWPGGGSKKRQRAKLLWQQKLI